MTDPVARSLIDTADACISLLSGQLERACECGERALTTPHDDETRAACQFYIALAHAMAGDNDAALRWLDDALELTQLRGESVWRARILMQTGVVLWRRAEFGRAREVVEQGLRVSHLLNDVRVGARCLEVLAWIVARDHDARRAAVLLGAASVFQGKFHDYWLNSGNSDACKIDEDSFPMFPMVATVDQEDFHEECQRRARDELDTSDFDAAWREGIELTFDEAVAVALTTEE
jgi:tetratricopeptide (TPR) repeat protein